MDNIIEPKEDFPFSKLSLTLPSGIQGGAYFTKIQFNNKPLYIQTVKSLTRQGIVKSGKKYYCDLMFDKNAEELIQWFEHLEETCQKMIYSKSESWFQTVLDMNDIESAFASPIRVYKSGKYYLVRVNIKNQATNGEPALKIYDENEIPLGIHDIHPETNIISILEIQGIKFTNRNFQMEIELKQIMVLNEPIFDHCLIKKNKPDSILEKEVKTILEKKEVAVEQAANSEILESFDPMTLLESPSSLGEEKKEVEENVSLETDIPVSDLVSINEGITDYSLSLKKEQDTILATEDSLDEDLKECTIQVETNSDSFSLKKPNEVYYDLYRQARKKAKEAKKTAIIAYLEAKNIQKTYLLENMDESDDDFDTEMNDFSEIEDMEI